MVILIVVSSRMIRLVIYKYLIIKTNSHNYTKMRKNPFFPIENSVSPQNNLQWISCAGFLGPLKHCHSFERIFVSPQCPVLWILISIVSNRSKTSIYGRIALKKLLFSKLKCILPIYGNVPTF